MMNEKVERSYCDKLEILEFTDEQAAKNELFRSNKFCALTITVCKPLGTRLCCSRKGNISNCSVGGLHCNCSLAPAT
jgi:hypothetical protein